MEWNGLMEERTVVPEALAFLFAFTASPPTPLSQKGL